MTHFVMTASLLVGAISEDGEPSSVGQIMAVTSLIAVICMVFIVGKSMFGKARTLQDKAIEQLDATAEHMHRVEQSMAVQEAQGARIVELLESIDNSLKRHAD